MNIFEISSFLAGLFIYVYYTLFMNYPKFTKKMYSICVCISSTMYLFGAIGITNRGTMIIESCWFGIGVYGVLKDRIKFEKCTKIYEKFVMPATFILYLSSFSFINKYEALSLTAGMLTFCCYNIFLKTPKFTKSLYSLCVATSSCLCIISAIAIRNRGVILSESMWLCISIWGFFRHRKIEKTV